jgi:hypothetical protein
MLIFLANSVLCNRSSRFLNNVRVCVCVFTRSLAYNKDELNQPLLVISE